MSVTQQRQEKFYATMSNKPKLKELADKADVSKNHVINIALEEFFKRSDVMECLKRKKR